MKRSSKKQRPFRHILGRGFSAGYALLWLALLAVIALCAAAWWAQLA